MHILSFLSEGFAKSSAQVSHDAVSRARNRVYRRFVSVGGKPSPLPVEHRGEISVGPFGSNILCPSENVGRRSFRLNARQGGGGEGGRWRLLGRLRLAVSATDGFMVENFTTSDKLFSNGCDGRVAHP